jgi:hypothetical protein
VATDTRLSDAGHQLLDNLAAELTTRGLDVPDDRRYVHAGIVAHDFAGESCAEAFVVSWVGSSGGELGSGQQGAIVPIRCSMPLNHTFLIAILRCVPVVRADLRPPTQAALDDAGTTILTDAMTMSAAIVDLGGEGLFDSPQFMHAQVGIANVSPIGPQGGVGGSVVQLVVSLTG